MCGQLGRQVTTCTISMLFPSKVAGKLHSTSPTLITSGDLQFAPESNMLEHLDKLNPPLAEYLQETMELTKERERPLRRNRS